MKWLGQVLFVLALLVGLLVFKNAYDQKQRQIGRLALETEQLRSEVQGLQRHADSLEKSLAEKVKVVVQTKTVWDTLPPLIPSLQVPNAPPVPASQVAKIILIGQDAIHACTDALSVCQALIPVKDSIIRDKDRLLTLYAKRIPGRWDSLREWGIRVGLFYLGMQVAK